MRQIEHAEHVPAPHHGRRVQIVLAGLKDPLNVGQAFRIAASLGVSKIYLCDATPEASGAKVNRTARGAQHLVPWQRGTTNDAIVALRTADVYVIAVEYATESRVLREVLEGPQSDTEIALVVGNEAHGLPKSVLSACDAVAHIPMYGAMSSLNVATALAISCYEAVR